MAKNKITLSKRVKRTIRKSVAGVCLASSIIVAAVPATPAKAYVAPGTGSGTNAATSYVYGVEETDYTDLSKYDSGLEKISLDKYITATDKETGFLKTYMVSQLSDGSYVYNWQFKIYEQMVNDVPYGIICQYNDTYAKGNVDIGANAPLSYVTVEEDFFNDYLNAHKAAKLVASTDTNYGKAQIERLDGTTEYVKSKYKITEVKDYYSSADDQYWMEKYFPDEYGVYVTGYNTWKNNKALYDQYLLDMEVYNQYLVDYAKYEDDVIKYNNGELLEPPVMPAKVDRPTTVTDPGTAPYLECWVGDMQLSKTGIYRYFCAVHPDYVTDLSADEYVLEQVKDSSKPGAGLTNQYVYMPKGTPKLEISSAKYNDAYGFQVKSQTSLLGIGDRAFEGCTNVDKLTIAGELKYIGDYSFCNSFVKEIDISNVQDIGNRAFKDCTRLLKVAISETTVNIGTEAFYGCNNLSAVALTQSISYIGPGAFANCIKLSTLDLSTINQACNISDFAFYNDIALANVSLSDNISRLGDCCFACTMGVSGNMLDFKFPDHISGPVKDYLPGESTPTYRDPIGNFVLAGRTNLKHVTMPADYGKNSAVTLPYGVFFNDIALVDVTFPSDGGACGYVTFGIYDEGGENERTIFDTIQTKDFCVYGPENDMAGNIASPRQSTWGLKSGIGNDIPYIYIDSNGEQQVEISNGQYILIIDDFGVLQSCKYANNAMRARAQAEGLDLVIPENVGDTKVTGVSATCFDDPDVHDYIKTLTIADNTISEIADNAFKNCTMLESVSIGNSVNKIGASAFEGCNKLVDVYFTTPRAGYGAFPKENIGENAFSTGADKLTFHGDINGEYGPFVWATDANNYVDASQGTRVCYKTNAPTYLTVIVDNRNGYPTLVDYPHYEDLNVLSGTVGDTAAIYTNDVSGVPVPVGTVYDAAGNAISAPVPSDLITRYEHLGEELYDAAGNLVFSYIVSLEEEQLVNAALNVDVPAGIKSIDANGFLNNTSEVLDGFSATASNSSNVSKYCLGMSNYPSYKVDGLFNGYYGSYTGTDGKREFKTTGAESVFETEDKGNDRVQSVTLHTVKYLPDDAFYSCERLTKLDLGADLSEMKESPFAGCLNLTSIAGATSDYIVNNGIVYKSNPDGTYDIVEVLSARGKLVGSQKIKPSEEDPFLANVSSIQPGAFKNCEYITAADLRGMSLLSDVPDNCFDGCTKLNQVVIPENIKSMGHNSLCGTMDGIELVVYGEEVYLPKNTFGPNVEDNHTGPSAFRVITYKNSAARRAAEDIGADVSETLDETCKVQFMDFDGREIGKVIYVKVGESIKLEDIPADPVRPGYTFTGWNKGLTNITEDTIIVATYKLNPDTKDPDISGNDKPSGGDPSGDKPSGDKPSGDNPSGDKPSGDTPSGDKPSGGDTPSGDNPTPAPQMFTLTVSNGNGSGSYAAGATVIITCTNPPAGQEFDKWVPESDDLGIASVSVAATTLTMPSHNAAVKATFKNKSASGNGSGTGSGTGTNTSTNPSKTQDNSGNTVLISKPGISNTSLASATVNGSTDNYVIRITENAAAAQAVEKALINEYGSLDTVRFSAMDISLYDSTGSTRITDTTGLSITITVPIPDALTSYAGNNKVAGVVNERLDKLTPKFVTIDGVPCITFTATHFSPYTIYVDTANLTEGMALDNTPKTGDFRPKWFLSIGLLAMSIALFFIKDKKTVLA